PAFDLTLRVDNGQIAKTCRENVTIAVFYGNMLLGWGRVPDFCVGRWTSVEMDAAASHADVVLTDDVRSRMHSELLAGTLELDVETRMWFPDGHDLTWERPHCNTRDFCCSRQQLE
ncbi:hypothetical protein BRADI_2g40522v3, partial [Brachypodium distachyon]